MGGGGGGGGRGKGGGKGGEGRGGVPMSPTPERVPYFKATWAVTQSVVSLPSFWWRREGVGGGGGFRDS